MALILRGPSELWKNDVWKGSTLPNASHQMFSWFKVFESSLMTKFPPNFHHYEEKLPATSLDFDYIIKYIHRAFENLKIFEEYFNAFASMIYVIAVRTAITWIRRKSLKQSAKHVHVLEPFKALSTKVTPSSLLDARKTLREWLAAIAWKDIEVFIENKWNLSWEKISPYVAWLFPRVFDSSLLKMFS